MRVLTLIISMAVAFPAAADSLWPGGRANFGNHSSLVTDSRALSIGDLVTVRVMESASAQQSAETSTNSHAQMAGAAGIGGWNTRSSTLPINSWGLGGQTNASGGGKTERGGKLVTTITARVVNIQENGNLMIEGRRSLKINEEKQHIFLRGVIRPGDIGPNNVVMSSSISDAQISYEGHGPLSEKAEMGFFTRILDWIGIL